MRTFFFGYVTRPLRFLGNHDGKGPKAPCPCREYIRSGFLGCVPVIDEFP